MILIQNRSQCTEKHIDPGPKKSKCRFMLIVLFEFKGVIMENGVPNRVTVNQQYSKTLS